MEQPSRFDDATARARRRAVTAGTVGAVVLGIVVAVALSILLGVVLLVLLGAGWVAVVQLLFSSAPARVVAPLGARPATEHTHAALHEALSSVAIQTGAPMPTVEVLDSAAANALVSADGESATVVVTTGLLESVRWVELEAVAAELLCRVRDGSARFATLSAGLPAPMAGLAGLSPRSVAVVLGDQRAAHTDLDAVGVTRYPPALIAALDAMHRVGTTVPQATARSAALWIAPAVGPDRGVDPALDHTANQPLDYRIAVLREL